MTPVCKEKTQTTIRRDGRECPEIYIGIRRTIDWRSQAAVDAELIGGFRPKLEKWNATFRLPYAAFRQRVKEIAQASLSRVRGVTVADLAEVPPGVLAIPVDDDDWFAPDVAERLREVFAEGYQGFTWFRRVLEARPARLSLTWLTGGGGRFTPRGRHDRYCCGTNNYAVIHDQPWADLCNSHTKASSHFDGHRERIRRIPLALSIQNRNLSSQTALGWKQDTISTAKLLRRFQRYRKLYCKLRLPSELAWAKPYVNMMADLMNELRVRN